jgi:hypothetical protein
MKIKKLDVLRINGRKVVDESKKVDVKISNLTKPLKPLKLRKR